MRLQETKSAKNIPDNAARHTAFIITGIVVVGFAVRLIGLSWGIPETGRNTHFFHPDEVAKLISIQQMASTSNYARPNKWAIWRGPFYMQFLAFLQNISGIKQFYNEQDLSYVRRLMLFFRTWTILFSVLSLYLIYRILAFQGFKRAGLIAASMVAIMPGHIINSAYLKSDVPMVFFLLLAYLFIVQYGKKSRISYLFLSGSALGIAIATKYTGAVAAVLIFGYVIQHHRDNKYELKKYLSSLGVISCGAATGFLFACPVAVVDFRVFIDGMSATRHYAGQIMFEAMDRPFRALYQLKQYLWQGLGYGLGAASFISVCAVPFIRGYRKFSHVTLYILVSYLALVRSSAIFIRHALPMLVFMIIPLSIMLDDCMKKGRLRYAANITVAVILAVTLMTDISYLSFQLQPDPRIKAKQWLESNIRKDAKLAVAVGYSDDRFSWPPIYNSFTSIRFFEMHAAALPDPGKEEYDVYIFSYFTYTQFRRLKRMYPAQNNMIDTLEETSSVRKIFVNKPLIFSFLVPEELIHDLRYLNPVIYVYAT